MDITKGFRKIGDEAAHEKENQQAQQPVPKTTKSTRPPMTRSATNVF